MWPGGDPGDSAGSYWRISKQMCILFLKALKNNFIYLFLAVLGHCCCEGFSLVVVCGLLIAEHGLWVRSLQEWHAHSVVAAARLSSTDSVVVARELIGGELNEGGVVMDKVGKHQEKSRFGGKEK